MRNFVVICASFLAAVSLAKADLVPVLCQSQGSACGATPAFTMLGANSYVYNYSINLSAVEQLNSTLGPSTVLMSGFTGVTGVTAPAGWTVGSFTTTSVTFDATPAVNGAGSVDFGIFAVDTTVGGSSATTGTYSSNAFKLNGLADSAQGGLEVNAPAAAAPEPTSSLFIGLALAGLGVWRRTRLSRP